MAKAIPEGMRSVIPCVTVKECAKAMDLWKKAFGAEEMDRAPDPSGQKIWHASLRIGDSVVFCNDEMPNMGVAATPVRLWLYLDNVDAAFERATKAGCKPGMPPADMFWGDRMGQVTDPWGNNWTLATHTRDMTHAEQKKAQEEFVAQMQKQKR
jgi:PhnB protein